MQFRCLAFHAAFSAYHTVVNFELAAMRVHTRWELKAPDSCIGVSASHGLSWAFQSLGHNHFPVCVVFPHGSLALCSKQEFLYRNDRAIRNNKK
jgi:hypothetical protein